MSNDDRFWRPDGEDPGDALVDREVAALADGLAQRRATELAAREAEAAAARRDDRVWLEAWNGYVEKLRAASALLSHVAGVLRSVRFPVDYSRNVLIGHDDDAFGHRPPERAKTRRITGWQLAPTEHRQEFLRLHQPPYHMSMMWTEETVLTSDGALILVGVTGDIFPSNEIGVPRMLVPSSLDHLGDRSFVDSQRNRLSSGDLYDRVPDCRAIVVDFVHRHPELVPHFAR